MKLIALKTLTNTINTGDTFEVPDTEGQAHLIIGSARLADPAEASTADPAPSSDNHTASRRRSYRRRDLTAEP
jgi:hypothetical protein